MTKNESNSLLAENQINQAIRLACNRSLGVLDSGFMCQSVSVLNPKQPFCVKESEKVEKVIQLLRENKVGCILVTNELGQLTGIFSERDCILKVTKSYDRLTKCPVSEVMTRDPITQPPDSTIAFTLNLMSQGGFRHLPIVAPDGTPTGMISVKDVIDYIVNRFVEDILSM